MLIRILNIATMGSGLVSAELQRRFLRRITNIIVLVIVSAFMLCALLATIICVIYATMVHNGADAYHAAIILSVAELMIMAAFLVATIDQIRLMTKLADDDRNKFKNALPDLRCIAEAFVSGFLNRKYERK